MASAEELTAIIGGPAGSDAVLALVASDCLTSSSEPDFEEGVPVRSTLAGFAAGYELSCTGGRVDTAFIYVVPSRLNKAFAPFAGRLPGGLRGSDARPAVLRRFGTPERSGEAFTDRILGRQGAWDRFKVGRLSIHFQYVEPHERIGQVTIMLAEDAP